MSAFPRFNLMRVLTSLVDRSLDTREPAPDDKTPARPAIAAKGRPRDIRPHLKVVAGQGGVQQRSGAE